ncbi:MAG TPA: cytochrome ubiquinol oxidase subunit I, partial [Thermomicrobiales bacterium]|nr:cytochrome ubiquinol oxidase subunit I [Thermomicrobiales bacterium]
MSDLTAARMQMASSLGFHIIFAGLGIGLPLLMIVAEGLWLRTGQPEYLVLAKRWSKAFALVFAVGAVSGTVLSFELGMLWPGFMRVAGGIIGMPFSLEGFAFFIEAIFLGIYLYGWDRMSPRTHWLAGWPIAFSGLMSGIFVVSANAWMNSPQGFRMVDGRVVDVDPIKAMFNPSWFQQSLHMSLAAYEATAFAVAGIYAWGVFRGRGTAYHRAGLTVALAIGTVVAILQPISGDLSARWVADNQPAKFAALEGQFQTETHAGLHIGGIPDTTARETKYALELPGMLSFLAHGNVDAEVQGLDAWPLADQPNPVIV